MKKIKLLAPLFSASVVAVGLAPVVTSCAKEFDGKVTDAEWKEAYNQLFSKEITPHYYINGYKSETDFENGEVTGIEVYDDIVVDGETQRLTGYQYEPKTQTTIRMERSSKFFHDYFLRKDAAIIEGEVAEGAISFDNYPAIEDIYKSFEDIYTAYNDFDFDAETKSYNYVDWIVKGRKWLNMSIDFNKNKAINKITYSCTCLDTNGKIQYISSGDMKFVYESKSLTFDEKVIKEANKNFAEIDPSKSSAVVTPTGTKEEFDNHVIIGIESVPAELKDRKKFTVIDKNDQVGFYDGVNIHVCIDGKLSSEYTYSPTEGTITLNEPLKLGQRIYIDLKMDPNKTAPFTIILTA